MCLTFVRCCQSCSVSLYVSIVIVVCVSVVVCMKLRSTSDWTMQLCAYCLVVHLYVVYIMTFIVGSRLADW